MSIPNIQYKEGQVVDVETGEVYGEVKEGFQVTDEDSVNWVLNKMGECTARMKAIESTEAVIHAKAIVANAEALVQAQKRKLDGLHYRFDNELAEYARKQLEGKKERTYKTLYGSISLRTVPGGLRVKNKAAADEYGKLFAPWATKQTYEFQISKLTAAERESIAKAIRKNAHGEGNAFELSPSTESISVDTGVE